jgi:hypothetical protein
LIPAGQMPLTAAVAEAAEVLDFREKPGLIVLLTDGWQHYQEPSERKTIVDV